MNTVTKIILGVTLVIFCFWIFVLLMVGTPIVIHTSKMDMKQIEVSVGDTINPFNTLYLDKGELSVYILIDKDDKQDVDPKLAKGLYLKCNDNSILKDLNRTFSCTVTGGDMTTVQSIIYIKYDNKIVFKSGIVMDKNLVGLQNRKFGWAEASDPAPLEDIFGKFEKCYWPILFI